MLLNRGQLSNEELEYLERIHTSADYEPNSPVSTRKIEKANECWYEFRDFLSSGVTDDAVIEPDIMREFNYFFYDPN